MKKRGTVFYYLLLFILLTSCACQQKTTKGGLDLLSKKQSIKTDERKNEDVISREGRLQKKSEVIYRSIDRGENWSTFAEGIPSESTLSGIKQQGNKIYVTTDYHGVFVSENGKDNWETLSFDRLKDLDINCIEVEGERLIIGTLRQGVLISNDGGENWRPARKNIMNTAIRAFIKKGKKLYAGTDSGIFESFDFGDSWTHVFGQVQILGFTSLNNKIYAATQNGVLVNNGIASTWDSIYDGDALHDIGNDGKYIYAMTIGQQLLKTQNDGVLWENAQRGITYPINYYTNELQHIGSDIFSAQWIGIYHSSNNGNNWQMLSGLPDSTAFSTLEITDFGIITGISIR